MQVHPLILGLQHVQLITWLICIEPSKTPGHQIETPSIWLTVHQSLTSIHHQRYWQLLQEHWGKVLAIQPKQFHLCKHGNSSLIPLQIQQVICQFLLSIIPLAICTHKACISATHSTDPFDTKIGWTDKGKMRLKQKVMSVAKDHYLTTDDFTEIWENFV